MPLIHKKRRLLQYPPLFCWCLFLFYPSAVICHWWGIASKWLKNHMYECQLIFQWCSWSILIILHALNSQFGSCCNVHHCFVVCCFYFTHGPSFATGEESS
jgi:hypothetical protein